MKNTFFTLFFFTLTHFFWAQNTAGKDLLWEISGNGLKKKSYLFGTLHSNDKRVFNLSDSVYVALQSAETIVLEANISELYSRTDIRKDLPNTFYDKNGRPYTPSTEATATAYGNEDGMPQFLDAYFQVYGELTGKKIFSLEKIQEQLNLMVDVPMRERRLVDLTLGNFTIEKLMEVYLKGDIFAIDRFMKSNLSVRKDLYEKLIVERNKKMGRSLDSLLQQKKSVFCAVGAGHLGGTEGMIQYLRAKGYRLRAVQWTISEISHPAKKAVRLLNKFQFEDETVGVSANFPGKPLIERDQDGSIYLTYCELGQGNTYVVEIHPYTDESTPEELASIYIASPNNSPYRRLTTDDGTFYFLGISDAYPEGLSWVHMQFGDLYFIVSKAYGGNKFMHSDRPKKFFDGIWFEKY
jgi:uncharacterized protein YbaP (TraB family)